MNYDPLDGKMFQILNENGKVNKKLEPKLSKNELDKLYMYMILARLVDEKAFALQRSGQIGTFAPIKGQEAVSLAAAFVLKKEDWVFPSFRENALFLYKGIPIVNFFYLYGGFEIGNKIPDNLNVYPVSIPVGTQPLHAVGSAMASKIKKDKSVTVTFFGDGATSEGETLEAMNFAGVFKAPVVFICQNNQFAISVSRKIQTAAETLAQKSIAFGFDGIQVDGNDILAMIVICKNAIEQARKGNPILIEAVTYRLGPHTTADDPTLYRTDREVKEWLKKDPIVRFQKYLKQKKIWSEKYEEEIMIWANKLIDEAVEQYKNTPKPKIEDMFNYMYENIDNNLKEQLDEAKEIVNERGYLHYE